MTKTINVLKIANNSYVCLDDISDDAILNNRLQITEIEFGIKNSINLLLDDSQELIVGENYVEVEQISKTRSDSRDSIIKDKELSIYGKETQASSKGSSQKESDDEDSNSIFSNDNDSSLNLANSKSGETTPTQPTDSITIGFFEDKKHEKLNQIFGGFELRHQDEATEITQLPIGFTNTLHGDSSTLDQQQQFALQPK